MAVGIRRGLAKGATRITGRDEVLANLNREIIGIKNRTRAGIRLAVLLVRRRAQNMTPVKDGNLKNSAYTVVVDTPKGPAGEVGYTASYAVYVHERMELRHAVGIAKFLETAYKISAQEILQLIRMTARTR